jgi:sugar phosphate isomerase/epimerase
MNKRIGILSSHFNGWDIESILSYSESLKSSKIEYLVDHDDKNIDFKSFTKSDIKKIQEKLKRFKQTAFFSFYKNILNSDDTFLIDRLKTIINFSSELSNGKKTYVGCFPGFDKKLGLEDYGYEKNIEKFVNIFKPLIKYAESKGVIILYENCPMEGWSEVSEMNTFNNITSNLAGRKIIYDLIESDFHGETYDPSHDIWQGVNPNDVIEESDINKIHNIHVKDTEILDKKICTYWGRVFPFQHFNKELTNNKSIPSTNNKWIRYGYKSYIPNENNQNLDWKKFITNLNKKGYKNSFIIENESYHKKTDETIKEEFKASVKLLENIL